MYNKYEIKNKSVTSLYLERKKRVLQICGHSKNYT